jgi:LuxR family maltose regulon positive regulatory protein
LALATANRLRAQVGPTNVVATRTLWLRVFATTKFQPPRLREEYVRRERCLRDMTGPLAARHLVISAPAGAGKSTLAAQWAAGFERSSWLSLAEEDDEPGRFWAAVISALGAIVPGAGSGSVAPLVAGADVKGELVSVIGELSELEMDACLVVDDMHLIRDPSVIEQIEWFIRHAPDELHFCGCSRALPVRNLDRLIAHGEIAVVTGADLLFSRAEVEEFMRGRLALSLRETELEVILQRTEGWAAGLYLTALAVRNGATVEAMPAGGDRNVRHFLREEVLAGVNQERLAFLEVVSILDRFSAEIVDYVAERSGAEAVIRELEQRNLFVIPLDVTGTWFRLHHLFAELLSERMRARDPDRVRRLNERAAGWHLEHGDHSAAVLALIRAERPEAAGSLVATHYAAHINQSRLGSTVARWLKLLPVSLVASSPPLCLASAWVAGINGRVQELEEWLARARERAYEGPLPDGAASIEAEALLCRTCFRYADFALVLEEARRAASLDRPQSSWWALEHFVVGIVEYLTRGPGEEAITALTIAESAATKPEHAVVAAAAPALLAAAHAERRERDAALSALKRAAQARDGFGVGRVPQAAISWWACARAWLLLGRLEQAERDALAGVEATAGLAPERDSTMVVPPCLIHLALVRIAQERRTEARALLSQARRRIALAPDPARLAAWLQEAERASAPKLENVAGAEPLSVRELTVLEQLASPLSLREIAQELSVSGNTVKSQVRSIYAKLSVGSRQEAVERGRRLGLLG